MVYILVGQALSPANRSFQRPLSKGTSAPGPRRHEEIPHLHIHFPLGVFDHRIFTRIERLRGPDLIHLVAYLLAKGFHEVGFLHRLLSHRDDGELLHHAISLVLAHAYDAETLIGGKTNIKFGLAIGGTGR